MKRSSLAGVQARLEYCTLSLFGEPTPFHAYRVGPSKGAPMDYDPLVFVVLS